MARSLALVLVALTLAGCASPPQAESVGGDAVCGRLTLALSSPQLAHPGNLEILERLSNCGTAPLLLDSRPCASLGTIRLAGPLAGALDRSGFVEGPTACRAREDGVVITVAPRDAIERRYRWNGSVVPRCEAELCPPDQPAPAGRYLVTARIDSFGTDDSWETTSDLQILAWTDDHGNWTEHHPVWRSGPANLSWQRAPGVLASVPLHEGWSFASDGRTFLYAHPADLLQDPASAASCRADGPPSPGAWVLLGGLSCAWAPFPAMACLGGRDADPCREAQGFGQASSG